MRRARVVAIALVLTLCGLFAAWHIARFSPRTALIASLAGCLPWASMLRGLAAANPRTCIKALLLTTPYLGYGLMEVLANPGARPWAAATVFIAFGTAVAAVALLRLTRRQSPVSSG